MSRHTNSDFGSAVERLFAEIEAYLAVVDAMRREGVEPSWASEPGSQSCTQQVSRGSDGRIRKDVERLFTERPR
jgi:hypothetical protein